MKRIMIVDDEPMIRQHIRTQFPWQEWGYEIGGEAENGIEALERCRAVKPDIVFIDITMPLMNGMELLPLLRQVLPQVRCIMLTAHRDFAYAQQAIREGVDGYILKSPIQAKELKAALQKAVEELDKANQLNVSEQEHKVLMHQYQYPIRQKFFEDILSSLLSRTEEIISFGEKLGIDLKKPPFLLLDCVANPITTFERRFPEKDRSLIEFSMLEIVRECVQMDVYGKYELFPLSFGRFVLLLSNQHNSNEQLLKENVTRLIYKISKPLQQFLSIQLTVTVSRPFHSVSQFRHSFMETRKHRSAHFYSEGVDPVFVDHIIPFRPIPSDKMERMDALLKEVVGVPDHDRLRERWIDKVKTEFLTYKPDPDFAIQWLEGRLHHLTQENGRSMEGINLSLETSFLRALQLVNLQIQELSKTQSRTLHIRHELAVAIQYIKAHISEDLNVEIIAQKVMLSPSYLGQLFKKEVGISIVDYILEQRMELAKKYLVTGQYRNYELASKVGFRSYSYFCTLFKKYAGVTPNEFKHSHHPFIEP